MMKKEYLDILKTCVPIDIDEDSLSKDIDIVDYYLDCVSDELVLKGFNESWEPNKYGFLLEEVISYLLEFRYRLEDE